MPMRSAAHLALATKTQDEQLWHLLADSTPDQAEGIRLADETVRLVALGRELDRYTIRQRRIVMVATPFAAVARGIIAVVTNEWVIGITVVVLFFSGLTYGALQIPPAVDHFANISRKNVGQHGSEALRSYYHGDTPPYFVVKSITQSQWDGLNAWKVVFVNAHTTICSFVWQTSGGSHHWINVPNCDRQTPS